VPSKQTGRSQKFDDERATATRDRMRQTDDSHVVHLRSGDNQTKDRIGQRSLQILTKTRVTRASVNSTARWCLLESSIAFRSREEQTPVHHQIVYDTTHRNSENLPADKTPKNYLKSLKVSFTGGNRRTES